MFFPNWGGFSDIMFSLGVILVVVFLVLFFFSFTIKRDEIFSACMTSAWASLMWGLIFLAVGYFTEIGIHHSDQTRDRHEQQAVRDLEQQGFSVVEMGLSANWAAIKSHGCKWEYDIGHRDGQHVLIRGSGVIASSPPVKPSEVGRDDPNLVCAKPA